MFEREDDLNLTDLEKAINEISELNLGMVPTAKPIPIELPDGTLLKSQKSEAQEVIRLPSQKVAMVEKPPPKFAPDSYLETEDQLVDAKVQNRDFPFTKILVDDARKESKESAQFQPLNPSAIEQAKSLSSDNYLKTANQLDHARIESQWKPETQSEVFPQLSPQVLTKVVKPIPEYKGINKNNEELQNLLEKFQAASTSKDY
jgi:hypothetical protein